MNAIAFTPTEHMFFQDMLVLVESCIIEMLTSFVGEITINRIFQRLASLKRGCLAEFDVSEFLFLLSNFLFGSAPEDRVSSLAITSSSMRPVEPLRALALSPVPIRPLRAVWAVSRIDADVNHIFIVSSCTRFCTHDAAFVDYLDYSDNVESITYRDDYGRKSCRAHQI